MKKKVTKRATKRTTPFDRQGTKKAGAGGGLTKAKKSMKRTYSKKSTKR